MWFNYCITQLRVLDVTSVREALRKTKWNFLWSAGPPPLNGHNFQTPHFSFAIESYIYETDFYTWCQSKLSLLSPLIIGSKLTFSGWSDCWLPYSALKNLNVTRDSPPPLWKIPLKMSIFFWVPPQVRQFLPMSNSLFPSSNLSHCPAWPASVGAASLVTTHTQYICVSVLSWSILIIYYPMTLHSCILDWWVMRLMSFSDRSKRTKGRLAPVDILIDLMV